MKDTNENWMDRRKREHLYTIRTKEFKMILEELPLPDTRDKKVLEVGCGSGIQSRRWETLSKFFWRAISIWVAFGGNHPIV